MKKNGKLKNSKESKKNIQDKKDENIILNYDEIEIDGFQVFNIKESANQFDKSINVFEIKSLDELIKCFDAQENLEKNKAKAEIFDNIWDNIIKINKNNIIDLSLINNFQKFLDDDFIIQRFLFLLFILLDNSLDNYIKDKNTFLLLKNNLKYFLLILINLKDNEKFNYFFSKEKLDYLIMILTKIQKIKNKKDKQICNNILFNLFSQEYIYLGSNLISIENNKEKNKNKNSKSKKILIDFYLTQKNLEAKEAEKKLLKTGGCQKIIESLFNFDSENFLSFKKNSEIDYSLHFYHQIELVENIIFILFSKEKYNFLKSDNVYYEYEFLDKLIKKNISETKEMHGDKHRNLFRRDTISNDIIKYFFFIFGNSMIIESIIKPLNTILKIIGLSNEIENIDFKRNSIKKERNITKDEFKILFEKIIEKLNENIPKILKIFLKMIYDNIIIFYPNLEKGDYTPISSLFFFSYISNPRIQKMFDIYPEKCLFIKSVYKLIYNSSFNIKFNEGDNLFIFNDEIDICYKKINEFYEKNVINIDMNNDDNKKYLQNLFNEIGVIYPEFIFYLSCDCIQELNM